MIFRTRIICCAVGIALAAPVLGETVKGGRVIAPKVPNPALAPAPVAPNAAAVRPKVAQPEAVSLPALSVAQIVEKNVAARGGLAAWKRVNSLSLSGKLDAGRRRRDGGNLASSADRKRARAEARAKLRKIVTEGSAAVQDDMIRLPFQLEMKRPLKKRIEIPFDGKTAVQVFDGVNGWKLRPYLGREEVEPFTADEARAAAQQQELDGPLVDYAAKGTTIEVEGGEKVDGHPAYKLKLALKNGTTQHLWIDAQTFLDVKIEGVPRKLDGRMHAVATYFRDYKPVEGLLLPYTYETRVEGVRDVERIVVERVAVNTPIADSRFSRP